MVSRLDHLVFASPDLGEGMRRIEELLGVRAVPGGRHEGRGTCNALVGLGPGAYLEVVGIDPEQGPPDRPRWFALDTITEPGLVTWAVTVPDVGAAIARARSAGVDLGPPSVGTRRTAAAGMLRWVFSDPHADRLGGVVPFAIDWGDSPHPSVGLESACSIESITLEHPEPARVEGALSALAVEVAVELGPAARVRALVRGPAGVVKLG